MSSIFRYTFDGDYSAASSSDISVAGTSLTSLIGSATWFDIDRYVSLLTAQADSGLIGTLEDNDGNVIGPESYGVYFDYSGGSALVSFDGTDNGDHLISGNVDGNTLRGFGGNDKLRGGTGSDYLDGGSGNDLLDGGSGADQLIGWHGVDTVTYNNSNSGVNVSLSTAYGFGGHAAGDYLFAIENLTGSRFSDTLAGDIYNNVLNDGGAGGNDTLLGGAGDDTYVVYNAGTQPLEVVGEGTDRVAASADYALVDGTSIEYLNTTSVYGFSSIDLTGNEFKQLVRGNFGSNVIDGGAGNDILYGMGGTDTFKFSTALGAGNIDKIMDFFATGEYIALDQDIFSVLNVGSLDPSAFKINTEAPRDADDRIIYNGTTGSLFYDADGLGGAVAVKFAMLQVGAEISASDFIVI